jgi:hypothetical protein
MSETLILPVLDDVANLTVTVFHGILTTLGGSAGGEIDAPANCL